MTRFSTLPADCTHVDVTLNDDGTATATSTEDGISAATFRSYASLVAALSDAGWYPNPGTAAVREGGWHAGAAL